jgi:hypothetical protein
MKRYCFAFLFLALACGSDKDVPDVPEGCIDESKISQGACFEVYMPVCGCNNVTYSNDCHAANAGVTSWTEGACK